MRVVAGRFGGRTLRAPPGRDTRPTSDRVREALFSMLGPLDGARVLDLYAGSGALGIEALSRGAERVTFVERWRPAQAAIEANLEAHRRPKHDTISRPRSRQHRCIHEAARPLAQVFVRKPAAQEERMGCIHIEMKPRFIP